MRTTSKIVFDKNGRKIIVPAPRRGEESNLWTGGRTKQIVGYVLIASPNHPYRSCTGYVQEHRLVMEKSLGRYLQKSEVVHHVNGIKDDNRIENLELMTNSEHVQMHIATAKRDSKGRFSRDELPRT